MLDYDKRGHIFKFGFENAPCFPCFFSSVLVKGLAFSNFNLILISFGFDIGVRKEM